MAPNPTRARPDLMHAVYRICASVTKAPEAVRRAAAQVIGYLLSTPEDDLKFQVGDHQDPILTVYTDASFLPVPWKLRRDAGSHSNFLEVRASRICNAFNS